MKTSQKGSITTIVLIIILLVVAVGGYMYTKNKAVAPEVGEGEPVSAVIFEDGFTN